MIRATWDAETCLIEPGRQAPDLVVFGVSVAGARPDLFTWRDAEEVLGDLLLTPAVYFVGHNIAYDWAVAAAHAPRLLPLIFDAYEADRVKDTEIRQKLSDIAGGVYRGFEDVEGKTTKLGYSLADLALRLTGRRMDKSGDTWRTRYSELRHLTLDQYPQEAKAYLEGDVEATDQVYQVQEANAEYLEDQHRQARAAFWLRLASAWGIRTDVLGVRQLAELTNREYESIARDLRSWGLLRQDKTKRNGTIEPGSRDTKLAKRLMEEACARRGKAVPLTDKGHTSLEAQHCEVSGDPKLEAYGKLGKLKTVITKDVPALERGILHPIHSRFEVLLETGRTSSSDPNIQNVRRLPGVRECFAPREGTAFVAADVSGLELMTLAQVCRVLLGWSTLGDALNQGKDPHCMIASQLLAAPYEALKEAHDAQTGLAGISFDTIDSNRQTGKVANFGYPGGLGPATFVDYAKANYGVQVSLDQAQVLKTVWTQTWPEMPDYLRMVGNETRAPFPMIKHLYSNRWRGGVSFTEACNSRFQGLGADAMKAAGWRIARACYVDTSSPLFGCRIVNFVHDEFILEAPLHRVHEAGQELSRIIRTTLQEWLPDMDPKAIKAKPVAMLRWSKKAKAVYDKEGRLIPWVA
jgi:DNA polymerase-1